MQPAKISFGQVCRSECTIKSPKASLAQNTKRYSRAADTFSRKMKVAEIVSGKQKSWHDSAPPLSHNFPPKSTALNMHGSPTTPCRNITNIPIQVLVLVSANTSESKRLSFPFKARMQILNSVMTSENKRCPLCVPVSCFAVIFGHFTNLLEQNFVC